MKSLNKLWFFIVGFSIIVILTGQSFWGREGLLWSLIFILGVNSYFFINSDNRVFNIFKGKLIEGNDSWGLVKMVTEISTKSRIPTPKIILINSNAPQALTTGRSLDKGAIYITKGLLKKLSPDEVKAVLAVQIASIKCHQTLSNAMASYLIGVIHSASLAIDKSIAWMISHKLLVNVKKNQGGVVTKLLTPVFNLILILTTEYKLSYEIDKNASSLIKNKKDLASALWKLDSYRHTLPFNIPLSTSNLFIVNPLTNRGSSRYLYNQPDVKNRIQKILGHYPV